MKTGKKLLSVLLAVVMLLSLGSFALANSPVDEDGWMRVPTSPDGLEDGDLWIDFTYLFSENATEEEKAAALEYFNSGEWSVNIAEQLVKCENGPEDLNGVYSRSQEPYILCIREVGVKWVKVKQSTVGIRIGDYYLDKDVYYQVAAEKTYTKLISVWEKESGQRIEDLSEEDRAVVLASIEETSVKAGDMYWQRGFLYNPGGNLCVWCVANMPAAFIFPFADSYIMIAAQAAQAALRQADEATVAAANWVCVASSIETVEKEGGYYLDLSDREAVAAAFGMEEAPSDETMAEIVDMFNAGEWYADFDRSVVAGRIKISEGISEEENEQFEAMWGFTFPDDAFTTMDYPESAELFALLKYRPAPDWKPLPLDTDGLNDGDYYLDTDAFMAIIGRGKTEEECAAVLEQIRQHVVFYYNPEGVKCVYKYEYTELPNGSGDPISGSAILPLDLGQGDADATLYDYNALRSSVKQYTAPAQPEGSDPDSPSEEPNSTLNFLRPLKAIINSILSFFRKLFSSFSTK